MVNLNVLKLIQTSLKVCNTNKLKFGPLVYETSYCNYGQQYDSLVFLLTFTTTTTKNLNIHTNI